MKKNVADADSVTDDDNDDERSFMVSEISEHTSAMSEEIDVPIICLDDEDDDDLKINKDYKLFLDHLSDDKNLGPLFDSTIRYEADSGKSETRKFETFSGDSKRSKFENDYQMKNMETAGFKSENPRAVRESIQRDNRVVERRKRRIAELDAARVVTFGRNQDSIRRDNKVGRFSEVKAETLGDVQLVRTEEDIERDNNVCEGSKKKADELKAETLRKAVRRKKNGEESVTVMDKDYMNYLTWLVASLKDSTTKTMEDLQEDPSDTLKEPAMVSEKELLAKVKVELDLESWSDDSDIIAVSDSPFLDGEETPFVASKSVIVDLDKETKEDKSSCWFRKHLMGDLIRPYNETEFQRLYREASIHRRMTRSRELRKGRESDYETDVLGLSYIERFDDFNTVYKRVDRNDKTRALKLLRGFFFYLKNVSHDGAFKPWMDPRFLQEMFN